MPPRWTLSGRTAAKMATTIRTTTSYLGCLPKEQALWMFTLLRTPGIWAMLKMFRMLKNVHDVLDVFFDILEKCSRCFRFFFLKVFEGCHQNRGRHISSWSALNWEWGRFLNRFCSKYQRRRNHSLLQVNTFRQNCSQGGNRRYFHFFLGGGSQKLNVLK